MVNWVYWQETGDKKVAHLSWVIKEILMKGVDIREMNKGWGIIPGLGTAGHHCHSWHCREGVDTDTWRVVVQRGRSGKSCGLQWRDTAKLR